MGISERVIEILKELSGVEDIEENHSLQDNLLLDSLSLVTLLIEIEEAFNITLDESDMNPFDLILVSDVIALVRKYRGESNEKEN